MRIVRERAAKLGDDAGKRRVGYERVGPDQIVQLLLRKRFGRAIEKNAEKLKSLSRDVNLASAGEQKAAIGVELKGTEEQRCHEKVTNPRNVRGRTSRLSMIDDR